MQEYVFPSQHGDLKINHHPLGCDCGAVGCDKGVESAVANAPETGVPNRKYVGPLSLPKALRTVADWAETGLPVTRLHPTQADRKGRNLPDPEPGS